ncbi:HYLS1-C domain-containing protein [Aphelenchoides bicaudatus]|nr:HYLS1-C domain-containing protein [Aphelenchoides bicaudatus]
MAETYTDEEIAETLEEMGLQISDQNLLDELREDINTHGEQRFKITDDSISNMLNYFPINLNYTQHGEWGNATINDGYQALRAAKGLMLSTDDHMKDLERMVDDFITKQESRMFNSFEEAEMTPEIPVSFTTYKDQGDLTPINEKENYLIEEPRPVSRFNKPPPKKRVSIPNPDNERRKINQMLKDKCKIRIHPEPGRLPFRTDPVALFKERQKEWAKYGVPGEAKRLNLRLKIRQAMLRRDIPIIKIQNRTSASVTKPEWAD